MEPDGDQPVAVALRDAFEEAFFKYQVCAFNPAQQPDTEMCVSSGTVLVML